MSDSTAFLPRSDSEPPKGNSWSRCSVVTRPQLHVFFGHSPEIMFVHSFQPSWKGAWPDLADLSRTSIARQKIQTAVSSNNAVFLKGKASCGTNFGQTLRAFFYHYHDISWYIMLDPVWTWSSRIFAVKTSTIRLRQILGSSRNPWWKAQWQSWAGHMGRVFALRAMGSGISGSVSKDDHGQLPRTLRKRFLRELCANRIK